MERRFVLCVAIAAAWLLSVSPCAGQQTISILDQHPWAKFPIGSWKTVQVISETFDTQGNVTNVTSTETRTTLTEVTKDGYTLRVEVTVEVAGKRFPTQVQTVTNGFYGEQPGQTATVRRLGEGTIEIDGQKITTEQRRVRIIGGDVEVNSVVHYSADVPPYQLQRETTTSEPGGKSATTKVEVVALDMPQRVLGDIKSSAIVKTVKSHDKGSSTTVEVQCDDVPGGVVSHSAAERDTNGEIVRRSTLQIVDYSIGIGHIDEASSVVRRRKYHRAARRRGEEIVRPPQRER